MRAMNDRLRIKVLFVRTDACLFDPRVLKEASSLQKGGYEVRVLGWDRKNEFARKETINGALYVRSAIPATYGSKWLIFMLPLFWIRVIWEIASFRPQVVHGCDLDGLIPGLMARLFFRFRVVYDIFDNFADKVYGIPLSLRRVITAIDEYCMRFADVIILTDEHRKNLLASRHLGKVEIIRNVPLPMTPSAFRRPQKSQFRVCYAGGIHEHRGLKVIAKAVEPLQDVETVFAGWVPRKQDLDFIQSQPYLTYLGKLSYERSLQLMASSDVILALYDVSLPINAMASSNKVYEAMSLKKPVITNKETTMADLVQEEHCGILVTYGDIDALREAILKLQTNKTLRQKLGKNGFVAFISKYNWPIMERRLLRTYSELFGTNSLK